jgi:hypothetical protein
MQEVKDTEEYVLEKDLESDNKPNFMAKLEAFLTGKYFVPIAFVLVAIIAFSLGRISGIRDKKEPVKVISENINTSSSKPSTAVTSGEVKGASTNSEQAQPSQNATAGIVVASKNGTKYHYPWCAGAKQISEKNKITFDSIEKAKAAGYTPASNCKGLK